MNKRLSYYFAHNFNSRKKFRKLELQLEKELKIDLFNPFYDNLSRKKEMKQLDYQEADAVKRIQQLQKKTFKNRFNTTSEDANLIVTRDLTSLARQDGLLTIIEEPSIGTTIEICNAKLMCKEIIVISEIYIDHPWIKVYANYRFKTIEEFEKFMKRRLRK